jgi:hypothetical protein
VSADRQRLAELFAALDRDGRRSLLEFAEFLAARRDGAGDVADEAPPAPRNLPRPDDESVIAALKRLRLSYPMLDSAVIDELEVLFADSYAGLSSGREASK